MILPVFQPIIARRSVDMTHWLLPFTNRTEMKEARKRAPPVVLKGTLAAFENEILKEHLFLF